MKNRELAIPARAPNQLDLSTKIQQVICSTRSRVMLFDLVEQIENIITQ
jgi:hypothetical protein